MEDVILVARSQDLRQIIREELEAISFKKKDNDLPERLSRRDVADFFGVSYQTVHKWTKAGKIKEHGFGKSKFYLKSELVEAVLNEQ